MLLPNPRLSLWYCSELGFGAGLGMLGASYLGSALTRSIPSVIRARAKVSMPRRPCRMKKARAIPMTSQSASKVLALTYVGRSLYIHGDVLRSEGIGLGLCEARVEVLTDDHQEG